MPSGRPTIFNQELADLICERVSSHSFGLNKLCEMYDDLPTKQTINDWRCKNELFSSQYAQAKLRQADFLAEEIIDICDDTSGDITLDEDGFEVVNRDHIQRARLRVDTRKWLASKLIPKVYGDKQTIDQTITINHEDALKELE